MSPQSGLPHNNRVGDFDVFALPVILRETGKSLDAGARHPGEPVRPGRALAAPGATSAISKRPPPRATPRPSSRSTSSSPRSAITWAPSCSSWAAPMRSSSPAASARTRPSSERGSAAICPGSASSSIRPRTQAAPPSGGSRRPASRVQVWCVPTNEEIVVARQAKQLLEQSTKR